MHEAGEGQQRDEKKCRRQKHELFLGDDKDEKWQEECKVCSGRKRVWFVCVINYACEERYNVHVK